MTVKVQMVNGGSDSVDFVNAAGTTLAQVKGYDDTSSNGHLEFYTDTSGTLSEKVRVQNGLHIQQDSSSNNRLVFRGQPSSSYRWNIDNYGSSNQMRFFREDDSNAANGAVMMTIDSNGIVTGNAGNLMLVSGTAVASTSGTSINFTGIPSWVKRITVMFSGVSTSGISPFLVQIGSGSVTTSGYQSGSGGAATSSNTSVGFNATTGFIMANNYAAGANSGAMTLSLLGSNKWVESHGSYTVGGAFTFMYSGGGTSSDIGGALDRVRITTVNGTDTFDAGSINILYE